MTDYLSRKIKIVSFIAILCVVFQHAINFTGYIDPSSTYLGQLNFNTILQYVFGYGFARGAVAIFFMLSGYLFFRNFTLRKTLTKFRSRFHSLFIPYILWGALSLLFVLLLQSKGGFLSLYTGALAGKSFMEYLRIIMNHGVSFQLWFLWDLMLYTLLAPLFYIILRYSNVLFLIPVYILWMLQVPLPPAFAFLYRGGIFYLLGAYIAMYGVYIPKEKVKPIALISILFWMVMLAIKTSLAFGVLPTMYVKLSQIDNMAMIMGIATLWFGYDKIASSKLMNIFLAATPFTFFLYASHEPLLEVIKQLGVTLTGRSDAALLFLYFASIVVVLFVTIGCGILVKKFTPKFYSLLTGGR
ncbi:MAG: acyltransferase [Microgenomates group bacterium]